MKYIALILLTLCLESGCDTTGHATDDNAVSYNTFIVYPIEKIRPHEKVEHDTRARMPVLIAGFEREPFIVGIYNDGNTPISVGAVAVNNSASASTLDTTLYRIDYVSVEDPTWIGRPGAKGLWPDPLVPIAGQADRFVLPAPVHVPPGENRTFLIDLFRPGFSLKPGVPPQKVSYEEHFQINLFDAEGKELAFVDVGVLLLPFSLPDTQALATTFGFDWAYVAEGHRELSDLPFDDKSLHLDYLHLLAANRVSVFWPARESVRVSEDSKGEIVVDWSPFEETAGKLLEGTLFEDVPKATTIRFPIVADKGGLLTDDEFYVAAAEYLARKGWDDRAYYYLPDEPLKREYPRVIEIAENIAQRSPNIRRLVTEAYTPALEEYIEIWCPDLISIGDTIPFLPFFDKNGKLNADWQVNRRPSVYSKRQAEGELAWFYTCTSAQIGRYPNFFIDDGISYHRVIPWIAYRYGFTGILHWYTMYSYHWGSRNPWTGQFNFYANGDGNLLYPGTPEMTGRETHIAVPSLRLIAFREGAEDYEYLSLLAEFVDENQSKDVASQLAKSSVRWEKSTAVYGEIKALISELLGSVETY